ncbi:MAG: RHS repeat-associated core domain-containing protein [Gemmataceae bacterium]
MLRLARRLLSLPVQSRRIRTIRRLKPVVDPFRPKFDNLEERLVPDGSRPHPLPIIYVGSGGGMAPLVRAYDVDKGTVTFEKQVYESAFTGGVRVATGDITLDGVPDLIVAPGPGGGSRIRVLDGVTGNEIPGPLGNFFAYDPSFTGGVFVACADVTGDTIPDVITAAGAGGGPHIKVYDGSTGVCIQSFYAFAPDFLGGSTIGAADFTGDGIAEVVVGAGVGGGPRVRVFSGVTGEQIPGPVGNFFAFDPSDRHGIDVNTDTLSGDVTGDGSPDILVGLGAGTTSQVKVFDGKTGVEARSFSPFDSSMTAGVRVASAYITNDQYADIVVGTGPGAPGTIRVFDGLSTSKIVGPMGEFQPFGGSDTGGLYVSASNDPVVTSIYTASQFGSAVVDQTIAFTATVSKQAGYPTPTGTITFISNPGGVALGTGTLMADSASGNAIAGIVIPASQFAGSGTGAGVNVQYSGDSVYANYGYFNGGYVSYSNGALLPCIDCLVNSKEGSSSTPTISKKTASGSTLGGAVKITRTPLVGQTGSSPDQATDNAGTNFTADSKGTALTGASTSDELVLFLNNPSGTSDPNGTSIGLRDNGTPIQFFDKYSEYTSVPLPAPTFHARQGSSYSLTLDSANSQIIVTDGVGSTYVFWDFSSGNGGKAGRLQSRTSPDGSSYSVVSWNTDGTPAETQTVYGSGSSAITESILSTVSGGTTTKTLRRKVGTGAWSTVRTSDTYNVNGSQFDNVQTVKDASGNAIDTTYIRYESSSGGYGGSSTSTGRVKFFLSASSYARLTTALGTNVNTLTDTQIKDYADQYYTYDSNGRVTTAVISGAGCSMCSAGQGTYTYSYATPSTFTRYANTWAYKVVETLPDSTTNTYYTDFQQNLLMKVHTDGSNQWIWDYRYDNSGRLIMASQPSAVSGFDETLSDLIGYSGGSATYLRDSDGLVSTYSYGSSTTATSTTAGDVQYYLKQTAIRHGELGTDIPQSTYSYIARPTSANTIYFPATQTVYRNDNGTGAQTTTETYTWLGSTAQPASITTTLPTVTTAQNGPNTATLSTVVFDSIGRPIWSRDAAGYLSYTAYDSATGAVVKTINDVNTANTGDFTNLPSGWSTPSGGGLHLITQYEVDNLGRTTKTTAPNGRIDYTVYNDANHEVRYYPGWNTSTNLPTGPISVSRDDRTNGYSESLTMSATPTVSGGHPTGTESISNLESLSRSYRNLAGQVTTTDSYFNFTGMTYSTAANIGTINTNYYRSTTDYSKQNGQTNRTVTPLGTITRTEYDSLGRAISTWVGTDDTPTTGYWATNNLAGTNMVEVVEYQYDSGGIGDGNITKQTQFPGGGAANRVTQSFYDWRNRPVAVKSGVESSESTTTNRPITFFDYDNLGQLIKSRMYDGDTISITSTSGVPNAPSASLLRSQSTQNYDELGRVYLSEVYSVDPNSGSVGLNTLKSNNWYDARGNVIKTSSPGGLVQKSVYDGVGRVTTNYATDGGGDSVYSDASNVTGDKVLQQSETTYDASGIVLSTTTRLRNHETTGTGALGTVSTGNLARVSYSANYYDLADRLTATANYGTNGASSWTRSVSVPSRSDTVLVISFEYNTAGRQWKVADPKGIESRTNYDALGRTTKSIENYVDGVVGDDNDKTTEYTYNAAGMTTLTAKLTGGGGQTTEWVYGVTTVIGSSINSNDIIGETHWPDPSTGSANSSQKDVVTVNALGQTLTSTDRNGTVHTLSYDVLGRVTTDTVTTLGTNIDGSVRRVETAYDSQGNAYLLTNYDATTGGSIVNQVQRSFNGLGQMTTEWQAHGAAVNTSTSPKVQYAYSEMAGGTNHSRPASMTYPNGRVISFNYGIALDDSISRLSALKDGTTTLESYDYLGLGTVVRRSHPQSGVDLSFIKLAGESVGDAGDQYTGMDRFGRVVDQRWLTASTGTAVDRYQYAYDRNGNRTSKTNVLNSSFNETFSYDNLNQLTGFGTTGTTKSWDYDALGNWDGVTTNGSTQTRTANAQNEITSISGATTPTYDVSGNMTKDETGKQYVYDAWNRLVKVKDSGGTTIATYAYDAITRRVSETASSVTTDLYYSSQWQVLEERVGGNAVKSYVWSPVYVDAMVARDRDTDANGSLDERLYVMHDANFNVTGLVNTSGTVVERFTYDPYGTATIRNGSWSTTTDTYVWQYLHQGGRLSGQSGLYSFRNREYSPTLGRWVTIDSTFYNSGNNLYEYNNDNPIRYVDFAGLQAISSAASQFYELTDAEKRWCILNGNCAIQTKKIKDDLYALLTKIYTKELEKLDNTVINAVKHCTLFCTVASNNQCGKRAAYTLGVAHENYEGNDPHSRDMDLHNNIVGISLSKPGKSMEDCHADCVKAAISFKLYWFESIGPFRSEILNGLDPFNYPAWSISEIPVYSDISIPGLVPLPPAINNNDIFNNYGHGPSRNPPVRAPDSQHRPPFPR